MKNNSEQPKLFDRILKRIETVELTIDRLTRGRSGILKHAVKSFTETRAAQAAAGVAFYAIFSLFPLLLVIIAIGSYFVEPEQAFKVVTEIAEEYIPALTDLIDQNLRQVFNNRGGFGIAGLLTLIWAASSVFTNLAYNINLAWTDARRRHFLHKRLVGLGMTAVISLMLVLLLAINWLVSLDIFLSLINDSPVFKTVWGDLSILASWLTVFLLLFGLYRWSPGSRSRWRSIFWGALFATVAWKAASALFSWYLKTLLDNYRLVYGSLGAIVSFLLLVYILAFITLFGAHLVAAIEHVHKHHPPKRLIH